MQVGEVTLISVRYPPDGVPDADEQQPAFAQTWAEARTNVTLARAQVGRRRRTAAHHVERRSSGAGTRLMAPANSPSRMMRLSPSRTWEETLDHPWFAEGGGEQIVERAEIDILARHAEHRGAAMAVERFHQPRRRVRHGTP